MIKMILVKIIQGTSIINDFFTIVHVNKLNKFPGQIIWYSCHCQEKVTLTSIHKAQHRT